MDKLKQQQREKQKQQELENRLRQEADEMQELLKEKNWYRKYVAKIHEEEEQKVLKLFAADPVVVNNKEEEKNDMSELIRATQKMQGQIDKEAVARIGV